MRKKINILILFILLAAMPALAQEAAPTGEPGDSPPYQAKWGLFSLPDDSGVGAPNLAVLFADLEPGWYIYGNDPQPVGMPTRLAVTFDPGGNALEVLYPPAVIKREASSPTGQAVVYKGNVPFFIPLGDLPSDPFTLKANLSMLICSDTACRPERRELLFLGAGIDHSRLAKAEEQPFWLQFQAAASGKAEPAPEKVQEPARPPAPADAQAPTAAPAPGTGAMAPSYFTPSLEVSGLAAAALFGLLAGLILNVMPCVLPILALKLHSLLSGHGEKDSAERKSAFRTHNIFFAMGILACFLTLSAVLSLTGQAWGQLFQGHWFVLALAAGVFVLALSLFGVFHLPVVDLKAGTGTRGPRLQAFSTGLMATMLATPCSGPLLGGVLGWALVQPVHVLALVMVFVGLGMALPYLAMAASPSLVRYLPRPGKWSVYLEKSVGFLLMGTCIYLLNILPYLYLVPALIMLLACGLAAWLWGLAGPGMDRGPRWWLRAAGLVLFAASVAWASTPRHQEAVWTDFSQEVFEQNLGKTPMLVTFTANWCPTCKFLEQTVLTQEHLSEWRNQYGLVFLKADLTSDNPPAQRLLTSLGGRSIPLTALFPVGPDADKPLVLRDLYTTGQIRQAMKRTFPKDRAP